jgi:DNA-binding response OmpR family regulator
MISLWIIDDDRLLLESLKLALEGIFRVKTFCDPYACLEAVKSGNPDVVLTDFEMEGLNGMELLRIFSGLTKSPRLIFYSAQLTEFLEQQALEAGASACFGKPFDLRELKRAIRQE